VARIFNEVEKARFLPLPASLFPVFEEARPATHRDGQLSLSRL
jgi:hypothetical protein